jgi:hypothetical protein
MKVIREEPFEKWNEILGTVLNYLHKVYKNHFE